MQSNVSYWNCRSCGRLLHKDNFKSGYCPPCLRGRIASVKALYDEAVRLIEQAEAGGMNFIAFGESLAFCKLTMGKIKQAEHEVGQPLIEHEDLSKIDAFLAWGTAFFQ